MGLEIGAVSPEEIAVSVVAEMIAVRRNAESRLAGTLQVGVRRRVPARAVAEVTCGLILAAGESRRMGSPKALLEFRGETFLDRLIGLFSRCCSPVIVVLGAQQETVRAGLRRPAEALIVENPDFLRGQLSSMQCGLRAVPGRQPMACYSPWWIILP